MTFIASEHVLAGSAWHGIKARLHFVVDPTVRALEMAPDLGCKARKAGAREVRFPKLRFYFRLLSLEAAKFCSVVIGHPARLIGTFSCHLRYARCRKHSSFAQLRAAST